MQQDAASSSVTNRTEFTYNMRIGVIITSYSILGIYPYDILNGIYVVVTYGNTNGV